VIWVTKLMVWVQGVFMSGLGLEMGLRSEAWMCCLHSKNNGFPRFSTFWQSWDLWPFGMLWDFILKGFGGHEVPICVVWRIPGQGGISMDFGMLPGARPGSEHRGGGG
jgi:hypothetical protein